MKDLNFKNKLKGHLNSIFVHDIEAAAFVIVGISLVATLTSFAKDVDVAKNPVNKIIYNPVTVDVKDLNGDGFNDMIITHADGHIEFSYSKN
jgi:hypothetical protein